MSTKVHEKKLLSLHSEWIGKSQMRVRVSQAGATLIVDVMEISHHALTRKGTDLRLAREAARNFGAASCDAVKINEFTATKMSQRVDEKKASKVRIRHNYYVFQGVE